MVTQFSILSFLLYLKIYLLLFYLRITEMERDFPLTGPHQSWSVRDGPGWSQGPGTAPCLPQEQQGHSTQAILCTRAGIWIGRLGPSTLIWHVNLPSSDSIAGSDTHSLYHTFLSYRPTDKHLGYFHFNLLIKQIYLCVYIYLYMYLYIYICIFILFLCIHSLVFRQNKILEM